MRQEMKAVDWAKLSAIAEIVGAVAIIVSLVFVGVQLNSSTRATRSATANEAVAITAAWYSATGTSEQASHLFWNAMADPDAQTPEDWLQFVFNVHGLMLAFQNSYYLGQEGTLDPQVQNSMTEAMIAVKDQPGFLRFWEQRRNIFFAEFQDYVDSILDSDRSNSEGIYRTFDSD